MKIELTKSDLEDLRKYRAAYDAVKAADLASLSSEEIDALFSRLNHACSVLASAVHVAVEHKEAGF